MRNLGAHLFLPLLAAAVHSVSAFIPSPKSPGSASSRTIRTPSRTSNAASSSSTNAAAAAAAASVTPTGASSSSEASSASVAESVSQLKKVLEREYTSFFDPMRREYYAPSVTFDDPMTVLEGVDQYQKNVDMLASRTLLGELLFEDAGIVLHTIEGGEVISSEDGTATDVSDIITRWTLRLTAKVLPWKPTARFTGISVYKVTPAPSGSTAGGPGVQIVGQIDYWDSVNIRPGSGGQYGPVDKSVAVGDFLNQLKPGGFNAAAAAPELPNQLLRRGDGYEVRRYPSYAGVRLPYNRRDEGFGSLGAFTRGMDPLAPALMEVEKSDASDKYMTWPIAFAPPGETAPPEPSLALEKAGQGQWRTVRVVTVPSSVVAVREFSDASMEPVVRRADRELRECLRRDGLTPEAEENGREGRVKFAQYDAIFSMGKRRGEVWIDLEEGGHPW